MELRSQWHCVDHDRLVVCIIVEYDNLQQSAGAIGSDDEISVGPWDHANWIANGVLDVFVEDAVLARAVRDVHSDKVALPGGSVKVTLSNQVDFGDGAEAVPSPAPPLCATD
jgi:hypothetical protein